MKKLLVVLSALLVLAFALPAMAMEMYDPPGRAAKEDAEGAPVVVFHGELTFGWMTPFDAEDGVLGFANIYNDITIFPFEYNAVLLELAGGSGSITDWATSVPWNVAYFQLETNVGEWLGLPIGLVNIAGRTSLYTDKFEVSGHAYERTLVRTNIDPLAWKFEADFGMAMLEVALGLGEGTAIQASGIVDAGPDGIPGTADDIAPDPESGNDIGFVLNIPEIGPAAVEVWYLSKDNESYNGILGADVNISGAIPFVDFAGGFKWDTRGTADRTTLDPGPDGFTGTADDGPATVADEWAWGAGVMVTYMMAELGVSANGNDSDTLNQLGVDLDVDPMQTGMWGFTGAVGFFADPASGGDFAYQGVELSAWLMVNAATLRAGYAITEDGYCYTCSVAGTNGGLFAVADIDW